MQPELLKNLITKILNGINQDESKKVKISKNLTFNLCNLENLEEVLNLVGTELEKIFDLKEEIKETNKSYKLYQQFIEECSIVKDAIKEPLINDSLQANHEKFSTYANKYGFFFKATTISFFIDYVFFLENNLYNKLNSTLKNSLSEAEFNTKLNNLRNVIFNLFKDKGLVEVTTDYIDLSYEFSIEGQLSLYDFSEYDSIVIGCARGLNDRSVINHNHACKQDHKKNSFMVDFSGYGHNSDIVGFNALNIEHWKAIKEALHGKKIKAVIDHTSGLFHHEDILESSYQETPDKLTKVALFIKNNIITSEGKIYYSFKLGEQDSEINQDVEIDSKYFDLDLCVAGNTNDYD